MLRNPKSLGVIVLAAIGLGYVAWIISGSQTFQSCFIDREHSNAYISLSESDFPVRASLLRVRLNIECVLTVLNNHRDSITAIAAAITAIATFVIALYTSALFATIRAMQNYANKQHEDMAQYIRLAEECSVDIALAAKKSSDAAERNLIIASRPLIEIRRVSLEDAESGGSPYIRFQCHNIGKGTGNITKLIVTTSTSSQTAASQPIAIVSSGKINFAIEPAGTLEIGPIHSPDLYETKVAGIRSGNISLHVLVQAMFSDIFGNHYEQRFPFVFAEEQGKFVLDLKFVESK
jgi:hypothetical protein